MNFALLARQPVSSILVFERFLKLAPDHPAAATAREELDNLRCQLPEILDAFPCDLPKELPRIAAVEKILHLFRLGRFEEMIKRSKQHLHSYPNDIRVRNNLAEVLTLKGDAKEALKIVNQTLELAPENLFAHAARCRLHYVLGRTEESRVNAESMLTLRPKQISDLAKAAHTFAFIGYDAGIRWAYEQAEQQNCCYDRSWRRNPTSPMYSIIWLLH